MWAFLSGVGALLVGLLVLRGFVSANPAVLARNLRYGAGAFALVVAALLSLRGGIIVAMPLAAFGFKLLFGTQLPLWGSRKNRHQRQADQTSRVVTDTLEMELDLDTGAMRGRVLKGVFAGQTIEQLAPAELAIVWRDCQFGDPKSARLIEAYLDRAHPTWREDMARAKNEPVARGPMTRDVALQILGLKAGASEDDIRRAHRELMKRFHPDHGGTDYLASKINEAKDALIDK
jgi:DnaJ domain